MMKMRARFRKNLPQLFALFSGVVIGLLVLPYLLAGEVYDYVDTMDGVRLPDVDAIVCLAGGRGRIAAAGDLWYRYWEASHRKPQPGEPPPPPVPVLYIAGMGPQSTWAVFRRQLRSGVRDVIPPEYVVIERESFNTEANARWLGRHISRQLPVSEPRLLAASPESGAGQALGPVPASATPLGSRWTKIVLVTSPYHMRRSAFIFQRVFQSVGQEIQIQTLSAFQEPFEAGEWRSSVHGTRVTMLEYFKWLYYRLFWTPGTG
ncbi:MAG: YdcF family protein [Oligoflexia bacterium]|nr:YdcF family protein [Oligoflexia bacterium]